MVVCMVFYVEDDLVNVMLMQGIVELWLGCYLYVVCSGVEVCEFVVGQCVDLLLCDQCLFDVVGDVLFVELWVLGLVVVVLVLLVMVELEFVVVDLV